MFAFFIVMAWPFWVATWLGERLGASPHSSTRLVIGWLVEALYLALLPWLVSRLVSMTRPITERIYGRATAP